MKIAFITDSIREISTGIGYYTKDVVNSILKIDKKNNYIYIDYIKSGYNHKKLLKIDNPFKYFKTYLWHNFLPLKVHDTSIDYIFNFSAVPHFFKFSQKEIFFVYDISWYLYPEYHPKSRVLFYKFIFKRCLTNSYKIVTDSESAKNDLVTFFKIPQNKIFVIYPPFEDKGSGKTKTNINVKEKFFLFIGTLEPRKNINTIIKAYKVIKDKYKIPHKLIICGKKGWLYNSIFKLINDLSLQKDVIYMGYISNEEKKYLYKHADLFVFPSFYEGFGIPLLEAMYFGCPIITSNVSSLPEVVGDAGIAVNPNSIEDLSNSMISIITDKKLRVNIINEGYKQLKRLSNTKQIISLLKSLE